MMNSISMTQLAASITGALGVEPPREADQGIPQVAALGSVTITNGGYEDE